MGGDFLVDRATGTEGHMDASMQIFEAALLQMESADPAQKWVILADAFREVAALTK